jgi:hypothetical protein
MLRSASYRWSAFTVSSSAKAIMETSCVDLYGAYAGILATGVCDGVIVIKEGMRMTWCSGNVMFLYLEVLKRVLRPLDGAHPASGLVTCDDRVSRCWYRPGSYKCISSTYTTNALRPCCVALPVWEHGNQTCPSSNRRFWYGMNSTHKFYGGQGGLRTTNALS